MPGTLDTSSVRLLSFNCGLLPNLNCGYGNAPFAEERVTEFSKRVLGQYDILILQEVFASCCLPVVLQEYVCNQRQLLRLLTPNKHDTPATAAGKFPFVVRRAQPSYYRMLRAGSVTDLGMIILSRFPVLESGSLIFRAGCASLAPKGCLFAKLSLSATVQILVVSVHLSSSSGVAGCGDAFGDQHALHPVIAEQLKETRLFLQQLCREHPRCPVVIAGDFNINSIPQDSPNGSGATDGYHALMASLRTAVPDVSELLFDAYKRHPPTRPAALAFPSYLHRMTATRFPQRQDYFFFSTSSKDPATELQAHATVERLAAGAQMPFRHLSDHFGISVTLTGAGIGERAPEDPRGVDAEARAPQGHLIFRARAEITATLDGFSGALLSEAHTRILELTIFVFLLAWMLVDVVWMRYVTAAILMVLSAGKIFGHERIDAVDSFGVVDAGVRAGKRAISSPRPKAPWLADAQHPWDVWRRAAAAYPTRNAIAYRTFDSAVRWFSYKQVDAMALNIGAGLLSLGASAGSAVGVIVEGHHLAPVVSVACYAFDLTIVQLSGDVKAIRNTLDSHGVTICVCTRHRTSSLVHSRSRKLQHIVQLEEVSLADACQASEVGIILQSVQSLQDQGQRQTPRLPRSRSSPVAIVSSEGGPIEMSPTDVLDFVEMAASTHLVDGPQNIRFAFFGTCTAHFNRVLQLALFGSGHAMVVIEPNCEVECLRAYAPHVLVCPRTLMHSWHVQLGILESRWTDAYQFLFAHVFRFRSKLIRHFSRDSSTLRSLFFRGTLGAITKCPRLSPMRVIVTGNATLPYRLREFIMLCVTPHVFDVVYTPAAGIVCVNGVPPPGSLTRLAPLCREGAGPVGELITCRNGKELTTSLAGEWREDDRLVVVGQSSFLLWPLGNVWALSTELESTYRNGCPLIKDIFITCNEGMPLVAVIVPVREMVEEMLSPQQPILNLGVTRTWSAFVSEATPLILKSLRTVALQSNVPAAHYIENIHLHQHSFSVHSDFWLPNSNLHRQRLREYFADAIETRYVSMGSPAVTTSPTFPRAAFPSDDVPAASSAVAVDIGGTCAKFVFFQPPDAPPLPSFCEAEKMAASFALPRNIRFFSSSDGSRSILSSESSVGELRFVKCDTRHVPAMIHFLAEHKMLDKYHREALLRVPATGGGALRFAPLVRRVLGIELTQVREMESVITGINFIIKYAPSLIFRFSLQRGVREYKGGSADPVMFPYLLVNIGSGVSLIRCNSPDGSHSRVGGSPIGGGTFWGLVRTMTDITSWDEIYEMTRLDGPGDNTNVDLLVGDIYGFNAFDLPAKLSVDTVASSFGKARVPAFGQSSISSDGGDVTGGEVLLTVERAHGVNPHPIDIVRSLLIMIANNITQIAHLTCRAEGLQNVFFTGGFVRNNALVHQHITRALAYWSGGGLEARFLEPDGYIGTIGSLMTSPNS